MAPAPAIVPDLPVASAPLPARYEAARAALVECSRIDECKDWSDKMRALASYARQADDDGLFKAAVRIQARAIRRAGELLKEFDGRGDHRRSDATDTFSQGDVAREAGLSKRQQVTAVRVANVPEADFERQVESDDPPTVTALAEQGKIPRPLIDLEGRDPAEFSASTDGQGHLRRFVDFARCTAPEIVVRGAFPDEHAGMRQHAATVGRWLDGLKRLLEI